MKNLMGLQKQCNRDVSKLGSEYTANFLDSIKNKQIKAKDNYLFIPIVDSKYGILKRLVSHIISTSQI